MKKLYEKYPFTARPSYERHPDYARLMLELSGIEAPIWQNCLELGCGRGSYLNCLAKFNPNKTFVGIDINKPAIEEAQTIAKDLGLENITFYCEDFANLKSSLKTTFFDTILTYGLYSWIEAEKRGRLLEVISEKLSPKGFAIISHNLLPGWKARGEIAEILKESCQTPAQVRAKLSDVGSSSFHGLRLSEEATNILSEASDGFIVHELLNANLDATSSYDFRIEAEKLDLHVLDPDSEKLLKGIPELTGFEARTIRNAILLKERKPLNEKKSLIDNCWFTTKFVPGGNLEQPTQFFSPNGKEYYFKDKAVQNILKQLAAAWPRSLSFETLCENNKEPNEVRKSLQQLITGRTIEGFLKELPLTSTISDKPKAHEISQNPSLFPGLITNPRFEFVKLTPGAQDALKLCDGTRTRKEICEELKVSKEDLKTLLELATEMALIEA